MMNIIKYLLGFFNREQNLLSYDGDFVLIDTIWEVDQPLKKFTDKKNKNISDSGSDSDSEYEFDQKLMNRKNYNIKKKKKKTFYKNWF
jgi:hypothetical protein